MSIQWTAIAAVLYSEIVLTALLLLPFISPRRWKRIMQLAPVQAFSRYASYYFNIFMVLLALCFFDSIREMRKYQQSTTKASASMANPVGTIEHMNMKLFRAQRNFYIAGFSLFLWLVLRRLITLIVAQASLEENYVSVQDKSTEEKKELGARINELTERLNQVNEAAINSEPADGAELTTLQSAYDKLKTRLERNQQVEELGDGVIPDRESVLQDELEDAKEQLARSEMELTEAKGSVADTQQEFDRLAAEHQDLQLKYNSLVETSSGYLKSE